MGDLLKNMRSSQIFSVCGMPEIELRGSSARRRRRSTRWNCWDWTCLIRDAWKSDHRNGDDVPAWFLDTDYNGLCFHVRRHSFPRTSAWENLKKALQGDYEETVWDHLAGTVSAPFEAGDTARSP